MFKKDKFLKVSSAAWRLQVHVTETHFAFGLFHIYVYYTELILSGINFTIILTYSWVRIALEEWVRDNACIRKSARFYTRPRPPFPAARQKELLGLLKEFHTKS